MTKIKAEIVADSLSPQGDRLTSLLITFPRIILAEVNTHRMLSKNTSSSRAVPFSKMVEAIRNNPFIPIAFQKHHKGMQGTEYMIGEDADQSKILWEVSKDEAINTAIDLHNHGVTKQLCNRLLEPFMWTTMLITGSKEGWDNFFELRCPIYRAFGNVFKSRKECIEKYPANINLTDLDWLEATESQAEIHMQALAEAIYDAMRESTPLNLNPGEWHTPFKNKIVDLKEGLTYEEIVKISTAMAARTSYTIVGDEKEINYERMIELHDRLISQDPPHSSPMEHCARAMSEKEYHTFIKGKSNANWDTDLVTDNTYEISAQFDHNVLGWCRNLKGFIPYRAIIENSN